MGLMGYLYRKASISSTLAPWNGAGSSLKLLLEEVATAAFSGTMKASCTINQTLFKI